MTSKAGAKTAFLGMAPAFTTQAGACLTAANWREAGINVGAFYLVSLLMKPGYDFLSTLTNLAAYVGWPERLVLNATLPPMNSAGLYPLCSQYDGRRSYYSIEEIEALITALQPSMVILPAVGSKQSGMHWRSLPETTLPFFPLTELPDSPVKERACGVYLPYDKKTSSSSELLQQLEMYQDNTRYVAGDLSLPLMLELVKNGATIVESDRPASDACLGTVYCSEGDISLRDDAMSMQFEIIEEGCQCPTCSQQLTRAYLHHLLEHTPLLCQRFLVQHNVYYCQTILS